MEACWQAFSLLPLTRALIDRDKHQMLLCLFYYYFLIKKRESVCICVCLGFALCPDSAGNMAETAFRTVQVVIDESASSGCPPPAPPSPPSVIDVEPPVITVNGESAKQFNRFCTSDAQVSIRFRRCKAVWCLQILFLFSFFLSLFISGEFFSLDSR